MQVDRLFELWDIDGSGYLEIEEIEMVLSKWREDDLHEHMLKEGLSTKCIYYRLYI